jgi:hypothetical protein
MSGGRSGPSRESSSRVSRSNGAPVSEELTAIRSGLHDLERKLDRVESQIVQGTTGAPIQSRARVIDFVSSAPPLATAPSIASFPAPAPPMETDFVPATQSPWLASMSSMYRQPTQQSAQAISQSEIRNSQLPSHPSEERFGIEEAAVSELVEFFENEKKCSVDPSGKPCDHCAMCSSRGF